MEIRAGRGIGGKDYVYLDVRHLGRKVIEEKLPDITDFARIYQGVEPLTEPVPVQPTAHYAMGGIPTDIHARVTRDATNTVVPGLYAAGECACVSVHGANRLGTNSLVDLLVFGRRAGRQMARDVKGLDLPILPAERGRAGARRAAGDPRPVGRRIGRAHSQGPGRRDDGSTSASTATTRRLSTAIRLRAPAEGALRRVGVAGQGPRLQHGPA